MVIIGVVARPHFSYLGKVVFCCQINVHPLSTKPLLAIPIIPTHSQPRRVIMDALLNKAKGNKETTAAGAAVVVTAVEELLVSVGRGVGVGVERGCDGINAPCVL